MVANYQITLDNDPSETDIDVVYNALVAFNRSVTGPTTTQKIAVFARDEEGKIIGGVTGVTHYQWLLINLLWLREDVRGQGVGTALMEMVEAEAIRRGCFAAKLDTTSFQALDFYRKLGYSVFGQVDDYPPGHTHYYLQKRFMDASLTP